MKKLKMLKITGVIFALMLCVMGCENRKGPDVKSDVSDQKKSIVSGQKESDVPGQEKSTDSEEKTPNNPIVETDLKPSEGLAFESNGNGTCDIVGIGICKDKNIVIPDKSPNGDTVTLIRENSFYAVENVDSITLVNYNYEVDKRAFQYGEFTSVSIIGGGPKIKQNAFSSCEDLTSLTFNNCNIQTEENAFYGSGKDATVSISDCTGTIGKRAFQYGGFKNLTISDCELVFKRYAFSSCEDLTSITFKNSVIETEESAFYGCGNSAKVEMNQCSLSFDDRTFQYSSLDSLAVTGSKVEMENYVFCSCEDLSTVNLNCETVVLGESTFNSCEELLNVAVCNNSKSDNKISIDDRAFQFCKRLKNVKIGNGDIEIGKYVFSNCADNLAISIAGKNYSAEAVEEGLK